MSRKSKERQTQILVIGNQKGGVGKTSVTVHLAAALGEMGKKCLIWDLDSNRGASRVLGVPDGAYVGTYEVIAKIEEPEGVILTNDDYDIELPENVHLIPARRNLEKIDDAIRQVYNKWQNPSDVLIEPIEKLRGKYDYILLDTAPSATTPTIAAYRVGDWFIATALPEDLAIQGLQDVLQDLSDVQEASTDGNPIKLLGVVLTAIDRRTKLARELTKYVYGLVEYTPGHSAKFDVEISRAAAIPNAGKQGKTVFQTEPTHAVTEQFRGLAREIEARIEAYSKIQEISGQVANG